MYIWYQIQLFNHTFIQIFGAYESMMSLLTISLKLDPPQRRRVSIFSARSKTLGPFAKRTNPPAKRRPLQKSKLLLCGILVDASEGTRESHLYGLYGELYITLYWSTQPEKTSKRIRGHQLLDFVTKLHTNGLVPSNLDPLDIISKDDWKQAPLCILTSNLTWKISWPGSNGSQHETTRWVPGF